MVNALIAELLLWDWSFKEVDKWYKCSINKRQHLSRRNLIHHWPFTSELWMLNALIAELLLWDWSFKAV